MADLGIFEKSLEFSMKTLPLLAKVKVSQSPTFRSESESQKVRSQKVRKSESQSPKSPKSPKVRLSTTPPWVVL